MTEQKTTTRFELRPIMCTNKETNIKQFGHAFDDDDLDDFMLDYHVTAVVREILDAAREACGDYETDSYFERWHGGRYMHGYSHITGGVVEVVEIETFVDADGNDDGEESRIVPIGEYTDEHKAAIEALDKAIDSAVTAQVERIKAGA